MTEARPGPSVEDMAQKSGLQSPMSIEWQWQRPTETRFIRTGCYFRMARGGSLIRLASYELRAGALKKLVSEQQKSLQFSP